MRRTTIRSAIAPVLVAGALALAVGQGAVAEESRSVTDTLGLLPLTLELDGEEWHLNKDGSTYLLDAKRVNEEPTSAERKASERVLNANADEVLEQAKRAQEHFEKMEDPNYPGEAADPLAAETAGVRVVGDDDKPTTDRGVNAQTGSNDAAQAMVAVLVAVMMGSAGFYSGRRARA